MSFRKRKRHFTDIKYISFPDDVENEFQKVGKESSSSVSSAKSWEKCGDSFKDTPSIKNLNPSGKKLSAIRNLAQSLVLAQTAGAAHCNEDIAWSSSDSESDEESREQQLFRIVAKPGQCSHRPKRPAALIQPHNRMSQALSCDKDDLPVIDTDSDLDEFEDVEKDSGHQISDCDSESLDKKSEPLSLKTTNMGRQESHGENIGHLVASSGLDSESFPFQTAESSKLSVRDWVRSAQAMLQTPEKLTDKQPKTPEDSAKKTRKFQSGGLAERLNRLQCRQRSAVSFWRHQSLSDASETKVDKPGVLVLEVLEVLEECSMQLVRCEHHQSPQDDQTHSNPKSAERTQVMVLFGRETAVHLNPAPKDIIHIYPPWQSLSIEGFGCDVILNTHFSQKVFSASKPASMCTQGLLPAVKCPPYSLCKTFGLLEECRTTENSAKQVTAFESLCCIGGSGDLTSHSVSLLEVIEGLGVAGTVRQDVEVVVQRVYSVTVPDPSTMSVLKPRGPFRSSLSLPPAEKGKTRLCLLVQDSYGMFSVTHLHLLPCRDDLHQFCHMWQGRTCVLRGMKVVQRVTRERHTRLFSLIDSLWPPVVALKDHGSIPSMSSVSRPVGPAPSFCYLLSGQESSVQPDDGQTLSPLYFPPTKQTLCDILQSELKIFRCSFVATVIYKRLMQSSDMGHGEVWLVLTDPSLQEEKPERMCKRTVALCVNPSCVLTSSVLSALNSSSVCCMSFRDAIRENGVLLCVEQSVIEVCPVDPEGSLETPTGSKSLSHSLSEPQAKTLPQPVRLDPLTPEITPNSLCSLTGIIIGVDEDTAYSWPACNHCGSDNLEMLAGRPETYQCVSCKSVLDKPDTRIQMEVFLSSSFSNCTLKVKLQRKTIMSVLGSAVLEGDEFPDCDVENVLGKEVGPLAVYVRVVTRKPALWISLEEICM